MVKEALQPLPVDEEPRILKDVLNLDVEKLDHYLNLFSEWIASQKHLPQNFYVEKLDHYLNLFSEWIASQKHLPQNFSKNCLKKFLIWSKLDFEKAKKKFEKFCYTPVIHEEYFANRVVSREGDLKILDCCYVLAMPKLTPKGERVTFVKAFDPDRYDAMQYCRLFAMGIDYRIHKDNMVSGDIHIYDAALLKPQHYTKIFNVLYLKFLRMSLLNYPFMVKHMFVINCHPILQKGVAICKSVLPEKMANRIMALQSHQDLHKYIPAPSLPADYGGTEDSLEALRGPYIDFMIENADFFVEIAKIKPTGSIPEEMINSGQEFGVEGSFRKLNID